MKSIKLKKVSQAANEQKSSSLYKKIFNV